MAIMAMVLYSLTNYGTTDAMHLMGIHSFAVITFQALTRALDISSEVYENRMLLKAYVSIDQNEPHLTVLEMFEILQMMRQKKIKKRLTHTFSCL